MNFKTSRAKAFCFATSTLALVVSGALAPAKAQTINLDEITVVATKTAEAISDALAPVSTVRGDTLAQIDARQPKDLFIATPGVWAQQRGDDPGQSINIRGLQDFGRVAVTIDGARQNFQHSGHNADGQYYIDPNMIGGVDISRGPIANIYGSGAIGGVVVYRTKDAEDILKPGEKWAVEGKSEFSTNNGNNQSAFAAAKIGDNIDIFGGGTWRNDNDYRDGHGDKVPNTGSDTWSGTAKITMRPAEGSTVKLGYTQYQSTFNWGQPVFTNFGAPIPPFQAADIYGTQVKNQNATARWLYTSPNNPWVDLDASIYWTRTTYNQTKVGGLDELAFPGFAEGDIGDQRNFSIETPGFDIHNTSRFATGPWQHALTYGIDGFRDQVSTAGFGTEFTPNGQRTVSGGFAQLKSNYSSWLEVISAVRYDHYKLEGGGFESDGSRVSPKFTVGVTPFKGFQPYVSYAEGYRAPAVTETLVSGTHPVGPTFSFLPNPSLNPEIGKNKEIGINLKYDNIFAANDRFRGKINVYRNDVDDYINITKVLDGDTGQGGFTCANPADCFQYQNLPHARIEGAEFESNYDTGKWFAGLAASYVHGWNKDSNEPLSTIPPWFVTTTLGNRFTDRITAAVRWQHVGAKDADQVPGLSTGDNLFIPTKTYDLVNVYLAYQVNPNTVASLSVENLLNQQYSPYMSVWVNDFTGGAPAVEPFYNPGITFRASLKARFGGG